VTAVAPSQCPPDPRPGWRRSAVSAGWYAGQIAVLFLKLALVTAFMASGVPEFIYAGF
jgi:hypothetical protein